MARLVKNCTAVLPNGKECNKPLRVKECIELLDSGNNKTGDSLESYECGHIFLRSKDFKISALDFKSASGDKEARNYQKEGIEFIAESDFNCIIGDQMRLGKTPQSLLALKNFYKELTPTLILVRSANLWQWIREYKTWTDSLPLGIFPIQGGKAFIPPGFSAYIMSMDTLRANGMVKRLKEMGFKLVIADEAHSFKNTDSSRSQALVELLKPAYMTDPLTREKKITYQGIDHKILLTGTAIKNRAEEYFVPLNLVAPHYFPSLEKFRREWLEQDDKGRWSRIKYYKMDAFKQTIKPFVLRREKEDVYQDLPKLNRMFTVITVEDDQLKKVYNKVLDKMDAEIANHGISWMAMQENLMLLRRIVGMAKVKWTADYVDIMLEDSEKSKIAIGIHHKDVRDNLAYALGNYRVMKLSGEDNAERKDWIMRKFEEEENRVLIINMLAGGVGMDFHYCNNVLVLERQWSSADEEQFEFRFYNPDKSIKTAETDVEYLVAKGTIDEWFYDLVEQKRQIFGETIGTNWDLSTDTSSFKDLIEKTVSSRL